MTTLVAQSDRQRLVFAPHFRSLNLPPGTGIFTIWCSVFVLFPGFAFQHPGSRLELAYEFAGRTYDNIRIAMAGVGYDELRGSHLAFGGSGGGPRRVLIQWYPKESSAIWAR